MRMLAVIIVSLVAAFIVAKAGAYYTSALLEQGAATIQGATQ